jgi:hypothetical protein
MKWQGYPEYFDVVRGVLGCQKVAGWIVVSGCGLQ